MSFVFNPQQQYLFNRAYALAIGAPKTTAALQYANFSVPGPNGQPQAPSPLRIRFDIDKMIAGTTGKSKIEVFNLSVQSRQAIKKGYQLRLKAGYNGLVETIFFGNVDAENGMTSKREGPDIITSMEVLDGINAVTFATLDKSYPAGTTLAQIIQDCAVAMSAEINGQAGIGAGVIAGIPNVVFNNGRHVHGAVRDTLDALLRSYDLKWSIQNGSITVTPRKAFNGQAPILVSAGYDPITGRTDASRGTGLIGVPSFNGQFMQFTHLLNPKIVPDAVIQMVSENTPLNGYYRVNRAHYEGDTHDTKWQVSCECIPMKSPNQSLPSAQGLNTSTAVIHG